MIILGDTLKQAPVTLLNLTKLINNIIKKHNALTNNEQYVCYHILYNLYPLHNINRHNVCINYINVEMNIN